MVQVKFVRCFLLTFVITRFVALLGSHLEYAQKAVARGELILGGALANPVDASILLFRASSAQVVEDFARGDPYVPSSNGRTHRGALTQRISRSTSAPSASKSG